MGQLNVQIQNNFSIGTIGFNGSALVSGDVVAEASASVPAAQPGVLTVRTDNNTGSLTMTNTGHGITTGARLDIYWSGGCRRGMVVGTVAGLVVPIDLGSGDNLPIATTAINSSVPVKRSFGATVANIQIIAATTDAECQFTYLEADDTTEDWTQHLTPGATGAFTVGLWYSVYGATPITGTLIHHVYMSHGDTAAAHIMSAAAQSSI